MTEVFYIRYFLNNYYSVFSQLTHSDKSDFMFDRKYAVNELINKKIPYIGSLVSSE